MIQRSYYRFTCTLDFEMYVILKHVRLDYVEIGVSVLYMPFLLLSYFILDKYSDITDIIYIYIYIY